jgi:hypothetical protein
LEKLKWKPVKEEAVDKALKTLEETEERHTFLHQVCSCTFLPEINRIEREDGSAKLSIKRASDNSTSRTVDSGRINPKQRKAASKKKKST